MLPETARLWSQRWLLGSNESWPRNTRLSVVGLENGQWIIPRGEMAMLQVRAEDKAETTESVWLHLEGEEAESETITMNRFQTGDFDTNSRLCNCRSKPMPGEAMTRPRRLKLFPLIDRGSRI